MSAPTRGALAHSASGLGEAGRSPAPLPRRRVSGPHERLGGPVEFADRAAGDDDVARARDVVDPQRVGARVDVVEHGRVGGTSVDLTLEYILVRATLVLPRRADLDLDADHPGIGVDDQRPDVTTDVQNYVLGVAPSGVVLLAARPVVMA